MKILTVKDIEKTLERIENIPDEDVSSSFIEIVNKQPEIASFTEYMLSEVKEISNETRSAAIELLFNVLSAYYDKYKDIEHISTDEITETIEEKHKEEEEQFRLLGLDINNPEALDDATIEEMNKTFQQIVDDIQSGKALKGKKKKLADFMSAKMAQEKQKHLLDYIHYYIENDEFIPEDDKAFISSIFDTLVQVLDKKVLS